MKTIMIVLILALGILNVGCSDKPKKHDNQEQLTNPNNDVPVP